ncbi:MAG: lysophospholipid acyltransferase family protein [Limisphaerales bacterium]
MHQNNRSKNLFQTAAFLGAYLTFAIVGFIFSAACFFPGIIFSGVRAQRFGRKLIHRLFIFFTGYLRCFGLAELDAAELSALRESRGLILVANHPGLLDAVLVVSQLPQIVCLMKRSLVRNVVLCGTARLAGYVHNEAGLGLVKKCGECLRDGANLLVFPEGTRSVGGKMRPFKMGFALVAERSQASVQTILITSNNNYLGKGWPFFKKPQFPLRFSLRLGKRFEPTPGMDVKKFGNAVENYFHAALAP